MQESTAGRQRKTLDPKLDIVFWMLFGAEQNRELLISLLNAVLSPAVPIIAVEVLPAQPERWAASDKSISLDVRVRLQNGEQVDVEMQSQRRPALRERGLYYWARLYAGQLLRGDPYTALRRCIVVLITNFAELTSERFHSIFQVRERRGAVLIGEGAGEREERGSGAAGAAGRDGGRERLHKFAGEELFGLGLGATLKSARWP